MKLVHLFWDGLFPYRCPGCNREVTDGICAACRSRLLAMPQSCPFCARQTSVGQACPSCRRSHALDGASVACYFEPPLREAVHRAKYGSDRRLARWLANTFRTPPLQIDQITAVPLHRSRRWRRGFNQAEELAKSLAENSALPYSPTLIRVRATVSQTELDREQRIANVIDVFKAQVSQNVVDKTILIVDDVLTTGSTLDACALELKKAGAARVWAATLARHR